MRSRRIKSAFELKREEKISLRGVSYDINLQSIVDFGIWSKFHYHLNKRIGKGKLSELRFKMENLSRDVNKRYS